MPQEPCNKCVSTLIVLSPSKCCLPDQNGENSSNVQVPQKMKAPELSDDKIKAPCPSSQPQDKLGEDGPLPQVTWRQIDWSIANPQPPVLAPGSRPWKKPPCQSVIVPQDAPKRSPLPSPQA